METWTVATDNVNPIKVLKVDLKKVELNDI